jgi:Rod binding domain-containing protein
MDAGANIAGSALTALQNQPLPTLGMAAPRIGEGQSGQNKTDAAMNKAASEFESVFITEFLGSMFSGIQTDGPFGGGQGEEMFRSLMLDQYAKNITANGGFGIASQVKAQMLKMQEVGP